LRVRARGSGGALELLLHVCRLCPLDHGAVDLLHAVCLKPARIEGKGRRIRGKLAWAGARACKSCSPESTAHAVGPVAGQRPRREASRQNVAHAHACALARELLNSVENVAGARVQACVSLNANKGGESFSNSPAFAMGLIRPAMAEGSASS
jgi:hypothetical protein